MAEHLTWWLNDRNPSISDVLTAGGVAVDLSTATVTFKMRGPLDGASNATVKVNSAVSAKDSSGNWRYDWAAADLDTLGEYLAWLEVTIASKTQTLWESIVEVRAHSAAQLYVELEQAKSTFELTGVTFADQDVYAAVRAASRAIDDACSPAGGRRRFYPDPDAAQVRYYSPVDEMQLRIDDLITLTTLKTDWDGDGVFETTWVLNTDFHLEPFNRELIDATNREPWSKLTVRPPLVGATFGAIRFPVWFPRSVEVTGKFGWPVTPEPIKTATTILIARLVKRMRETPLGVMHGGLDGVAIRIARTDPDIQGLITRYIRGGVPFR